MILAAALCAEKKGPPPLELEYAWQSGNGAALPNNGGLRDQPYALMKRMTACYNVWQAMDEYIKHDMNTKWVKDNPHKWNLIVGVFELYSLMDQGKIQSPIRPVKEVVETWLEIKNIVEE